MPAAADGDVADADLVELPPVERVVGEDLLFLAPLSGRDPHAVDLAPLVGGDGPLDGGGVVDAVVGDGPVLGDRDAPGGLLGGRGHLLQVDQVDDVEGGAVVGVALEPEHRAGRVGVGEQRVGLVEEAARVGLGVLVRPSGWSVVP